MKVLLLGHSGFVGSGVHTELISRGITMDIASRATGCDLRDFDSFYATMENVRPNVVINCAAMVGSLKYVSDYAADVAHNNLLMLTNMYRVLGLKFPEVALIQPIANCMYPGASSLFREDEWSDGPVHPSVLAYGATRRMGMTIGECYRRQYGVRSVFLIAPNMYGPNDSHDPEKAHALNALVSKFVKASHTGTGVEIWGTGTPVREWLYVNDFARVACDVIEQLERQVFDEPINIARDGTLAFDGKITYNTSYPDGAPSKIMSQSRFRRYFPNFEFTPFPKGLDETIQYYQRLFPY